MASSATEASLAPLLHSQTWHDALSRTDGRDKLFRLLQYVCKLLRGTLAGRSAPLAGSAVARIAALEAALGSSRQIWRLFKWVSVYARAPPASVAASRLSFRRAPAMPDVAAVAADSALFAYLLADNVAFVRKAGVLPGDAKMAARRAARFWLVAAVASAAGAGVHWWDVHKQMQSLERALEEKGDANDETVKEAKKELELVVRRQRAAAAVAGKHVADAVVATSLSRETPFHPAVVGAVGVFSSAVGLWQVWPRYVPTG